MPPLEVWEKVNVSDPEFFQTLHGRYGCIACHGNAEVFLTADDVRPEELEANKDIIVTSVP